MNQIPTPPRPRDAERTKSALLAAATSVLAESGYAGTRVDDIAERTGFTKRMIYYYFGGKEQLYLSVLEAAYQRIRETERQLDVGHLGPAEGLRRLAELTYDQHLSNSEFIRLIAIENIHRGRYIRQLDSLRELNRPALDVLDNLLQRGRSEGAFRSDVSALDVHLLISSYCVFQIANQHTFGYLFDVDLQHPIRRQHLRGLIGDVVMAWISRGR